MDILLFQLAIIFLPGLLWARLDARYAMNETPSQTEVLLRSFVYGMSTYAVLFVIYRISGAQFSTVHIDGKSGLLLTGEFVDEIILSIPVAFALAYLWIVAANRKWLTRILQATGATKRYGDEDVWDYTFNSSGPEVEYIHFRDFDKNITYAGWVSVFSESEKLRELVLRDVRIYDAEGECQEVPLLYPLVISVERTT